MSKSSISLKHNPGFRLVFGGRADSRAKLREQRCWLGSQTTGEMCIRDSGKPYQLAFIDEKSKETPETGLVCREWLGYLNLNLTMLISRLEALKEEWRIKSDDEVRIVFWFDN